MAVGKLKVLFHPKDSPWLTDSGYGIMGRYLVDGLRNDIDLAVFAPVGHSYKLQYYFPDLGLLGIEEKFAMVTKDNEELYVEDIIPVYPGVGADYGEDLVDQHYQHFHAEILWQIADVWALSRIPDLAKQDRIRWVIQVPVDFLDPIPPHIIDKLSPAIKVVPWVQDGKERLEKAGLRNVADPIPVGINTDLWKPIERIRYTGPMRDLGFEPDAFNISIVAANQYMRKAWEQVLKGIRLFREKKPDVPVRLYLHTHPHIAGGWDMQSLAAYHGLGDITRTANPYKLLLQQYPENQIMLMHALADVVINAGLEGFGVSTIQAQAVGTPVIGLGVGATVDLVESGILVPAYNEFLTPDLMLRAEPHAQHIANALEMIYQTPRNEFTKGVTFVHENFAWPIVLDKWRKLFQDVDRYLEHNCIKSERYPPHPSERALKLAEQEIEVA